MRSIKYLSIILSVFFLLRPIVIFSNSLQTATAVFSAGCFWCAQADFDKVPGVIKTIVGYTGGNQVNPSYEQVSEGETEHYESIQVIYDPSEVSYEKLLDFFWHHVDFTDPNGQFCDVGNQYRSVIFYQNENQRKIALESKEKLMKSGQFSKIVTQILPEKTFYPAEEYHQKYYQKNPIRYNFYRYRCGRDQRIQELWNK